MCLQVIVRVNYNPLLRPLLPQVPRRQHLFQQLECQFREEGEQGGRHGPLENEAGVVEGQAGDDGLAETAGADERGQRGGADVDDGRRLDAGQDRRRGEGQLDVAQALPGVSGPCRPRPCAARGRWRARRRDRVAQDRQQGIKE